MLLLSVSGKDSSDVCPPPLTNTPVRGTRQENKNEDKDKISPHFGWLGQIHCFNPCPASSASYGPAVIDPRMPLALLEKPAQGCTVHQLAYLANPTQCLLAEPCQIPLLLHPPQHGEPAGAYHPANRTPVGDGPLAPRSQSYGRFPRPSALVGLLVIRYRPHF